MAEWKSDSSFLGWTIKNASADKIDALKQVAFKVDGRVVMDYSGRMMYGKTCCGIICDDKNSCLEQLGAHGLLGALVDQLGKGYIVYFPKLIAD